MKKILASIFIFFAIFSMCLSVYSSSNVYNWFCVHRKDHKQPLYDNTLAFIEKYGGFYIDKKHGDNCNDKVIYLTFDAGYDNGNVGKILKTLKKENVHAAFFVLGHLIESNTELVSQMFEDGHLVCNHSFSHKPMLNMTEGEFADEINKLNEICLEKTGRELSKFFRPPEGKFNEDTLRLAQNMGYRTVFWSFAYDDWDNNRQMSSDKAKSKIMDNIHNGEIMLLHPTSKTNADILGDVIHELKKQGYRFGSLNEICH